MAEHRGNVREEGSLARHKRAAVFILVAVSLLLGLGIGEIYLRIFHQPLDLWALTGRSVGTNPMETWANVDAFSAYRGKPGNYGKGKTVNGHGFISTPELEIVKPADTIRVVFLGGSSTAGTGQDLMDEETWPWKTSLLLQEALPNQKIEFINAALGGYTSFESYGRLWSRIRFFSPDILVVNHGWNEMYYFDDVDTIALWRTLSDGSWSFSLTPEPVTVYEPLSIDRLLRYSQLLTLVRVVLSKPVNGEISDRGFIADDYDHRGLEIWRTNLRLIRDTVDELGAELFVMKQPTLCTSDLAPDERDRCQIAFHGFSYDAHVDAFQELYRVIEEEIPADHVIDVATVSGKPEYFYDHVHPTAEGATAIAEVVSTALIAELIGD